jgi:4-amino-4-deoxy-L-arabinose transferase-like glycosyltransferase
MPKRYPQVGIVALCWLAAALRLHGLFANDFHPDEALYASFARQIAVWQDPLLLTFPVDKPPLFFYLQAGFFPFFGPVEWAARMLNLGASIALVALTGVLSWRLSGRAQGAILAAGLVTLSPLAIQFSASAFLDPFMTALVTAALALATDRRSSRWSGLALGLAVATKYQAWLFLPLLVALAWLYGWDRSAWRSWLAAFLPILAMVLAWDVLRSGRPALWTSQLTNFGGLRPILAGEMRPRAQAWQSLASYLFSPQRLYWLLLVAAPVFFWRLGTIPVRHLREGGSRSEVVGQEVPAGQKGRSLDPADAQLAAGSPYGRRSSRLIVTSLHGRQRAGDVLLVFFLAAYALLHWLLAIPAWDRYFLPILPLAAVVLARLIDIAAQSSGPALQTRGRIVLLVFVLVTALPAALAARNGRFPVGARSGADQGVGEVAPLLTGEPYGTVLYDHWYSWQWRYHLFNSAVYVSWFATPADLVEDLAVFGNTPGARYLAAPDSVAAQPVLQSVQDAGFDVQLAGRAQTPGGVVLFRIVPREEMP